MTITADELAKVHAFYLTEGDAYSVFAEDLGREVERLRNEEQQATEDAYRDELARIQYDAETTYALNEHGAQLSGWDETTEFQRGVTTAGVYAILVKLEADGRLVPPAPSDPEPDTWQKWFQVPDGVPYRSVQGYGPWVNRDGGRYALSDGERSTGSEYLMSTVAPFERVPPRDRSLYLP